MPAMISSKKKNAGGISRLAEQQDPENDRSGWLPSGYSPNQGRFWQQSY